ncbi:MAG: sulfur carrier protein ThiS [Deltaproteobacteria bacterium]|jgi:thiamine biosynthesis protein ThiS|nr:sulfur carrier protein ThiS [Deltaproteobacteria bacterium]
MDSLTVNGKPHPHAPGMTVASLLAAVHGAPAHVVVEVNGEIVPLERYGAMPLNGGDAVEIVHFVGGG